MTDTRAFSTMIYYKEHCILVFGLNHHKRAILKLEEMKNVKTNKTASSRF